MHPPLGRSSDVSFCLQMEFNEEVSGDWGEMGRRIPPLLLFVTGYLAMASLAPLVSLAPALLSFFAGVLLLIREPDEAVAQKAK